MNIIDNLNTVFGNNQNNQDDNSLPSYYLKVSPILQEKPISNNINDYNDFILSLKEELKKIIDKYLSYVSQAQLKDAEIKNLKEQLDINSQNTSLSHNTINNNDLQALYDELNSLREFKAKFTSQHIGRRPKKDLIMHLDDIKALKAKNYSNSAIAKLFNVSETTIRRYLNK